MICFEVVSSLRADILELLRHRTDVWHLDESGTDGGSRGEL